MASDVIYDHAPITEAACEFRFLATGQWDNTIPGLVYHELRELFPNKVMAQRFQVQRQEQGPTVHIENLVRLQHREYGERAFVQISEHYLSVHHLAPYLRWTGYQPLIVQALEAYRRAASPTGYQRIGLRYINRIVLPEGIAELADYLTFYPHLGPNLPQFIGHYKTTVFAPIQEVGSPVEGGERDVLRLELRSDDSTLENAAFLDLDYSLARSGSVAIDDGLAWVDKAHEQIRTSFDNALTDTMKARLGRRQEEQR